MDMTKLQLKYIQHLHTATEVEMGCKDPQLQAAESSNGLHL